MIRTALMRLEKAKSIDGWMSEGELEWLASNAQQYEMIAELGCFKGRSTRALADNTKGTVYAVDPWLDNYYTDDGQFLFKIGTPVYKDFLENTKGVNNIQIIRGDIMTLKSLFPPNSFDMIFIDGDHRRFYVRRDIINALYLVRKGGIISGHDYRQSEWPAVSEVVDEFFPNAKIKEHIWWTPKS